MKVLLLTPHYPPEIRSVSVLMSQLAEDLAAMGHVVTVLAPYPPANVDEARGNDGPGGRGGQGAARTEAWSHGADFGANQVQVVRVPVLPFVKVARAVRAVTHFTLAGSMVLAGLRTGRHDAVIVYSPPLPLALAAEILSKRWGAPFILNVQDLYPQALIDLGLARNAVVIGVLRWLERRAYRHAAAITVHSLGNRRLLLERGVDGDKVTVVPNWIDTSTPPIESGDSPYRAELDLGDRFVVLFAGVMGYAQDMTVIVEAAAALQDDPRIVFLLVGDGVRRAETEAFVRGRGLRNVRFLPFQPIERYPSLVAAADCCLATLQATVATPVVPSKIAGIMAEGRPAIAALPSGDARALIEESGGGICVAPGDATGLAEAIRTLVSDPAGRRAMGEAGRRHVEMHFSRSSAIRAYARIIDDLVRANPFASSPPA